MASPDDRPGAQCAGASARCRAASRSSTPPAAHQVPDSVGEAIARACARRAPTWARLRDQPPRRRDRHRGRGQGGRVPGLRAPRGDLRAEHDLAELHALAHRRARLRSPATRSSSPRSTTTAASRRGSSWPTTRTWVQHIELRADTTLDYDDLAAKLTDRTRVVAFAWASNAIGTIVDAARVCELAHEAGALAWIDAVHYAAHEPIDVQAIGADVLLCSPYKFCGPHLGHRLRPRRGARVLAAYKARPAPMSPLGRRFETGTLPYELLAGFNATIDYLDESAGLTRSSPTSARSASASWTASPTRVTVYGLPTLEGRVPTFLVNVEGVPAAEVARTWRERGIGVWAHDSGTRSTSTSGSATSGDAIRIGFIHYNTAEEVDRLIGGLEGATRGSPRRPGELRTAGGFLLSSRARRGRTSGYESRRIAPAWMLAAHRGRHGGAHRRVGPVAADRLAGRRPCDHRRSLYPVGVVGIWTAWAASRRCRAQPRLRSAWRLLALASALYLAGDIAQTIYVRRGRCRSRASTTSSTWPSIPSPWPGCCASRLTGAIRPSGSGSGSIWAWWRSGRGTDHGRCPGPDDPQRRPGHLLRRGVDRLPGRGHGLDGGARRGPATAPRTVQPAIAAAAGRWSGLLHRRRSHLRLPPAALQLPGRRSH